VNSSGTSVPPASSAALPGPRHLRFSSDASPPSAPAQKNDDGAADGSPRVLASELGKRSHTDVAKTTSTAPANNAIASAEKPNDRPVESPQKKRNRFDDASDAQSSGAPSTPTAQVASVHSPLPKVLHGQTSSGKHRRFDASPPPPTQPSAQAAPPRPAPAAGATTSAPRAPTISNNSTAVDTAAGAPLAPVGGAGAPDGHKLHRNTAAAKSRDYSAAPSTANAQTRSNVPDASPRSPAQYGRYESTRLGHGFLAHQTQASGNIFADPSAPAYQMHPPRTVPRDESGAPRRPPVQGASTGAIFANVNSVMPSQVGSDSQRAASSSRNYEPSSPRSRASDRSRDREFDRKRSRSPRREDANRSDSSRHGWDDRWRRSPPRYRPSGDSYRDQKLPPSSSSQPSRSRSPPARYRDPPQSSYHRGRAFDTFASGGGRYTRADNSDNSYYSARNQAASTEQNRPERSSTQRRNAGADSTQRGGGRSSPGRSDSRSTAQLLVDDFVNIRE
jgi:hypothetical protein